MSNSTFTSDRIDLLNLKRFGSPQAEEKGRSIVPFPEERDYEDLQESTPEEFLPTVDRWLSVGGIVMVGIFSASAALSTVLKYKIVVQAEGVIRPIGDLRVVQSTIEGSVLNIAVRENQTINQGDIIATVKDLRLESKLNTKRNQLVGEIQKGQQQIAGIDAQILALDRQGVAEMEQIDRSIAGMQAEFSRAERDYRDKQIVSQAEVAEAEANWRTAQREQDAGVVEIAIADANLKSIQAGYRSAVSRYQRYQKVAAAGAISTNQLEEALLAAQQQYQSIAAQIATIDKQKQTIARLAESVSAAKARVERNQAALNPSQSELVLIQQRIKREQANGKAALARFQQEREKLLQQRVEIINQIATNQKEIGQIATDLQPSVIRAPIGGTIQDLNLRNNFQVVNPGDRIAQILPAGTPLNIKAAVAISDIDNVKVGQTVQMRVSACPYTDKGVLSGKVTEIAADAKSPDKSAGNNALKAGQDPATGAYEVTIKPDTTTLGKGATKCQIRSGMEGKTEIISKEETVAEFMLKKARLLVGS